MSTDTLHCSVCGAVAPDPWHYSTATSRHKHACDKCWPGVREADRDPLTAPEIERIAYRASGAPVGEWLMDMAERIVRGVEEHHGIGIPT